MAEARTGAATGSDSIALELALPTYHTRQSFRLGDARIIGDVLLGRDIISISIIASRAFVAARAKPVFWRIRHR